MSNKLQGKVVVVTGASKGIGASIAKHLAAEGTSIVVNYSSSKSGADAVVAAITAAGGTATAIQGDFSKPEEITRTFAEVKKPKARSTSLSTTQASTVLVPSTRSRPRSFTASSI